MHSIMENRHLLVSGLMAAMLMAGMPQTASAQLGGLMGKVKQKVSESVGNASQERDRQNAME